MYGEWCYYVGFSLHFGTSYPLSSGTHHRGFIASFGSIVGFFTIIVGLGRIGLAFHLRKTISSENR
jgi:hypothetical protein